MTTTRLVLWDVDLTLVDLRGFGTRWYTQALRQVADRQLDTMPATAGRTERAIASDVLRSHGVSPEPATITAMFDALTAAVDDTAAEIVTGGRALPGAADALATLAATTDITQTVVTGNLPAVASQKLAAFELHHHVDLDIGGFGTRSEHRLDLIGDAVRRAEDKLARSFRPEHVAVIGDTPHDVAGALTFGARAIGVATGHSEHAELSAAGAHAVLSDLRTPRELLRVL